MMVRDPGDGVGDAGQAARNVLGEPLEICFDETYDGVLSGRLHFSKSRGNDLSTPVPALGFPVLKPGARWCLCASRWQEVLEAGQAPRVVLRATHEGALAFCSFADLRRFAMDLA